MLNTLPRKTTLALATFAMISAFLPHGIRLPLLVSTFSLPLPCPRLPQTTTIGAKPAPLSQSPLEIPAGSLDTFYASLRRIEAKQPGAITRVLHYGDSPTTADSITSDIRRLLQARFGDAGHGYLLIAKPWAWYGHNGIKLDGRGWTIEPANQGWARDGIHGLGGVSFKGEPGAASRVILPDDQYTRVIIYYLAQPGGGNFTISTREAKIEQVHTAADEMKPSFAELNLPPGTRAIQLAVTSGSVRLFGYRFDKDHTGVQYSSLGVNGAQVQMIVRHFDAGQWTLQLRHENPDLVVISYGTNESLYPAYVEKEYPRELRRVIATLREALPHASILLMGPMDRGTGPDISTPPALHAIIEAQRKAAAETGCAFFNTFAAMGGEGTMNRWYHSQPRLVSADFLHPMPAGAAIVGSLFEKALMAAYEASKQ